MLFYDQEVRLKYLQIQYLQKAWQHWVSRVWHCSIA